MKLHAAALLLLAGPALGLESLYGARPSSGCGKERSVAPSDSATPTAAPALQPGSTTVMTGVFDGVTRSWRVYVPTGYTSTTAVPLVVSTHGWGGNGKQDESSSGLSGTGGGYIAVYPDGYADNPNTGSWGSWNCVGSTQSPGKDGQTCTSSADPSNSYCYSSCNGCKGADGCDWTTCLNDITPTGVGTQSVNGFIPQLYDWLEENLCIDTTREYHTGMSNGAMFTYQAGASMSTRLAAIAPVAGSFHKGFNQAPTTKVPVLDLHGDSDKTVPANTTTSADGWKYTITQDIVNLWVQANGCSAAKISPYTGNLGISSSTASSNGLGCVDRGCDVITCSWKGGHTYFGGSSWFGGGARNNGLLIWSFLSQYSNAEHIGKGLKVGEVVPESYELRLRNVTVVHEKEPLQASNNIGIDIKNATEFTFVVPDAHKRKSRKTHYGDPARGCRSDEDAITLTNGQNKGTVCAPKRKTKGLFGTCTLGGVLPNPRNGCPTDIPKPSNGTLSAFPQCLLDNGDSSAKSHCFLTCNPCQIGVDECDAAAHNMCPGGAACIAGLLRNVENGICVYGSNANPVKYHLGETWASQCYEMIYNDAGFVQQGYKAGPCDSIFDTVDKVESELICNGDSTKNVKDCPDSQIEIYILKRGKDSSGKITKSDAK